MKGLPERIDLARLGIDRAEITQVQLIGEKWGGRLYRVRCDGRSVVIKCSIDAAGAVEIRSYALLARLGVPMLPVHGQSDNAIVLEDLEASPTWRLGTEADCENPAAGRAVAEWYRVLHQAGRKMLAEPNGEPEFLRREDDTLDAEAILAIGRELNLAGLAVWGLCADHIEPLKRAIRACPATLTYNDFHWSNLALARGHSTPLRAVMFDFHLLGIGMAYSDYRNVLSCLRGGAAAAFKEAYGQTDQREAVLDGPMAILAALKEALCRPALPGWAQPLIAAATNGKLQARLSRAIQTVQRVIEQAKETGS